MSLEFSLSGLYTTEPRFALTHLELYTFRSVAIRAKRQSIRRPAFYIKPLAHNSMPTAASPSPSRRRQDGLVSIAGAMRGLIAAP